MKIVRYAFVGGCAAVVDFGIFAVGVAGLSLPWFPVAIASFLVATAINYLLSIAIVFESGVRYSPRNEWMAVLAVSAGGLAWNQVILWSLIEKLGIAALAAKIVATGCVFLWNYGLRRYFVFLPRRQSR